MSTAALLAVAVLHALGAMSTGYNGQWSMSLMLVGFTVAEDCFARTYH